MALSKRANQLALLVAAPIAAMASLMEVVAISSPTTLGKSDAYEFAGVLFAAFGYPLTRIIFILAPDGLQHNQNWWGIPLLDGLLIFQWLIWFQAAVYIGRGLRGVWRLIDNRFPAPPTIWPDRITRADGRRFKMRPYKLAVRSKEPQR
jgi:hypothetical protein